MNADVISLVMRLRVAVGYLGEKDQKGWWTSSFLSPTSKPFLSPVFPRTFALAQLHGVTAAAAAVHDDRIGVGDVFHLFRLPEGMEESLHRLGNEPISAAIAEITADQTATSLLAEVACEATSSSAGPVRIGTVGTLRRKAVWGDVAGNYLAGFHGDKETFPFFTGEK